MTTLLEKYIAKVSEIPVQVDLGNRVFIDRSDIQSLLPELIKEVEEAREEWLKGEIEKMKKDFPCDNAACGKESHPCGNTGYITALKRVLSLINKK